MAEKFKGIAFIIIGVISVISKMSQGTYDSNYAFHDIVVGLGNILLVGGLLLITLGISTLMALKEKRAKENLDSYQSESV